MLYIHAPWPEIDWQEAIPQIDQLIDEGIVRHFGVSNFTVADMIVAQQIAKHPIVANQMNYNVLYKDEVTEEFSQYCVNNQIQIVAYQPIKRQEVLQNTTVQRIATEHNMSPAQIALAWLIEKNALPIPKAVNKSHIDENVLACEVKLSEEDIFSLDAI